MNPSEVHLDLSGSKILIVDDVPANLDVLVQALDKGGYNILVASDGETALEVASYSQPDLILLDVMMPGIDGYETCRRLKEKPELRAVPVIFLTARDDLAGIVQGFEVGGLDYVTKPFKREEVLARIRTHLERAILARRLAELNARLEEKVAERTRQLQLKVKELEGKDRIAQHLLTFHSLEETLAVVLEVVAQITGVTRAVVYLEEEEGLRPAAAIRSAGGGTVFEQEELPPHTAPAADFALVREGLEPVRVATSQPPRALVPILRNGVLLGLIEVEESPDHPLDEADLHTLSSFALQAAVAINDAQVRQDPESWQDQLDEVLEIHQELGAVEGLDELSEDLKP
ncbi:MAG: response regulator [Candidatus Latescibacteria bacterium]|nr:response regulator [Candidatus Latescibacterota bacterium]